MIKTCKNCKHFEKFGKTIIYRLKSIDPDYDDFAFEERLAGLYLDAHTDSYVFDKKEEGKDKFGLCSKNKILYSQKLDEEKEWAGQYNDCLVYWDAEDYEAGFRVGEDFGCIHFEPLNKDEDTQHRYDSFVNHIKSMPIEEKFQSLVDAGIYTQDGELTENYK